MPQISRYSAGRAQSETVGVILLTAVVVVLATMAGAVVIAKTPAERTPAVNIQVSATSQFVTVEHAGGDTLATSDVDIIVEGDSRQRVGLDSLTEIQGSDSARFAPGDIWRGSNPVEGEQVRVTAIHVPTNRVLDAQTVDVTATIAARIGYSPELPTTTDTIEFSASNSEVKDSTLTAWEWEFDGTTKNGETVTYAAPDDGDYQVNLTVTAGDGRTASATKTVTVYNEFPTASFTYSPTNPVSGDDITFDASGSSDADGSITSYEWEFNDSGTVDATGDMVTTSFSSAGNYSARLTVTDDDGATNRESQTVVVGSASGPPKDPGFAYEDVNNDGVYSSADGDFEVDVSDGTYDAASNGSSLVIPDSVSAISAPTVSFKGQNVTIETDVTSSGSATLSASTGNLDISGQRIESNGGGQTLSLSGTTMDATGATIDSAGKLTSSVSSSADFSSATVRSRGSGQELKFSGGGAVTAPDATITSDGKITVSSASTIDLSRSTVRSQGGGQELRLSGGNVTAPDATITSDWKITVSNAPTIDLSRSTVRSQGSGQELKLSGGNLTATDATITSEGSVTVTLSDALDIDGATIESRGDGQEAKFEAASVRGVGATIDSAGKITAKATSSTVRFTDATLDVVDGYTQGIEITSNGDMYIDNARLVGDRYSPFTGNRQKKGNILYVGGAVFEDGSGTKKDFDVNPGKRKGGQSGDKNPPANVNGTPQKGTVV